jgi:hypothetical protein
MSTNYIQRLTQADLKQALHAQIDFYTELARDGWEVTSIIASLHEDYDEHLVHDWEIVVYQEKVVFDTRFSYWALPGRWTNTRALSVRKYSA